jgi:hypothetical protein
MIDSFQTVSKKPPNTEKRRNHQDTVVPSFLYVPGAAVVSWCISRGNCAPEFVPSANFTARITFILSGLKPILHFSSIVKVAMLLYN